MSAMCLTMLETAVMGIASVRTHGLRIQRSQQWIKEVIDEMRCI